MAPARVPPLLPLLPLLLGLLIALSPREAHAARSSAGVAAELRDAPLCETCVEYATGALAKAKEIKNEEQFVDALDTVCDGISVDAVASFCRDQVKENEHDLWEQVKQVKDLSPHDLCKQLSLC